MVTVTSFSEAAEVVKTLKTKPSQDNLLKLYGLFKIANDEDISKSEAPGMFDLKGKAKRNAWQGLLDEGVDKEAAEKQYIELVQKLVDAE